MYRYHFYGYRENHYLQATSPDKAHNILFIKDLVIYHVLASADKLHYQNNYHKVIVSNLHLPCIHYAASIIIIIVIVFGRVPLASAYA